MAKQDNYPPKGAYQLPSDADVFGAVGGPQRATAGTWVVPQADGTVRLEDNGTYDPIPDPGIPGPSPFNIVRIHNEAPVPVQVPQPAAPPQPAGDGGGAQAAPTRKG
jgi:hypothetical protein